MLKVLLLRKRLDEAEARLAELGAVDFDAREAELAKDIEEAATDEERSVVEEAVEKFDAERDANKADKAECERAIEEIKKEIAELEERQAQPKADPEPAKTETKENRDMLKFDTIQGKLTERAIRSVIAPHMESEEMRSFVDGLRGIAKRGVSNGDLVIPDNVLPLIEQVAAESSVLMPLVDVSQVKGTSRVTIGGAWPEAVWTEASGKINEEALGFAQTTLDGWKVAGYIPVSNPLLEDNDINLSAYVIRALGISVATATDAAVIYGTGTHMPLGILPRLAQVAQPDGYTGLTWEDLSKTNILTYTKATGADANTDATDMITTIAKARKAASSGKYARGDAWYVMSEATKTDIEIAALALKDSQLVVGEFNSILAATHTTDLVPEGDIIIGHTYGYKFVQRAGYALDTSEHVQFLEDNTVFRAKTRGDGKPVIAANFAAVNILGGTVATTRTWPADAANNA